MSGVRTPSDPDDWISEAELRAAANRQPCTGAQCRHVVADSSAHLLDGYIDAAQQICIIDSIFMSY